MPPHPRVSWPASPPGSQAYCLALQEPPCDTHAALLRHQPLSSKGGSTTGLRRVLESEPRVRYPLPCLDRSAALRCADKGQKKKEEVTDPAQVAAADLADAVSLIGRAVAENESRFVHRAVRLCAKIRRNLSADALKAAIVKHFGKGMTVPQALSCSCSCHLLFMQGTSVCVPGTCCGCAPRNVLVHLLLLVAESALLVLGIW